jgi:hypothetical protein
LLTFLLFGFDKRALPQIEWVNIFIEPANTPLSVIPAEAGIQCLLVPGRWIPAKNVQE